MIIKAAAGGGGRGMRIARSSEELRAAYETAQNEARVAFGVPDIYVEKYVENPRHIEFQVMGDNYGKVFISAKANAPFSGAIRNFWKSLLRWP